MRGRHHDSRFEGILKMKLQASDASAPEGLQSQNLSRPENRLSVNGLAIVHGRPDNVQNLSHFQGAASSRMKERPMSDETPMGQVIQIDEARIRDHLGEMVRGAVKETLNALLDAEADRL